MEFLISKSCFIKNADYANREKADQL